MTFGSARRALVPSFPYGVFYRIREDAVQVVAVLHLHRDPATWEHRVTMEPDE